MKSKTSHSSSSSAEETSRDVVRYAVIGLGHIAQSCVLPAFAQLKNSALAALVSGEPAKLEKLGKAHGVDKTFGYGQLDEALHDPDLDAVYVTLPNDLHYDCCIRAAEAGKHVLCEKPIATNLDDARRMLEAARDNGVRFMTAYRLHFEPGTLETIRLIRSGRIGEPRIFNSTFSYQLTDKENIRLQSRRGGGAVFDLGVYCINAARCAFGDEPSEVFAVLTHGDESRFRQVEEGATVVLRFPGDRVATFAVSFGALATSRYEVIGTKGRVIMDPGYEYAQGLRQILEAGGRTREKAFPHTDQFGGEIELFSDVILGRTEHAPSELEGVADLRIIEAIFHSDRIGEPVRMGSFPKLPRPNPRDRKTKPAVKAPPLVEATPPTGQ